MRGSQVTVGNPFMIKIVEEENKAPMLISAGLRGGGK